MNPNDAPPLPPVSTPEVRKKPSALASCILLFLLLGLVSGIGGGGYLLLQKVKPDLFRKDAGVADNPGPAASPPGGTPAVDPGTSSPPASSNETAANPPPVAPKTEAAPSPGKPAENPSKPMTAAMEAPSSPPGKDPLTAPLDQDPAPSNPSPTVPPVTVPPVTASVETPPTPATETPPMQNPAPAPAQETAASAPPTPDLVEPSNPDPVVAPEPVQTFAQDTPEVVAMKAEADRRIDEAPAELYSNDDKDRVRQAIRRSKNLTRLAILQFGTNSSTLGGNEKNRFQKALLSREAEALLSDPQAVFFLIGYADSTGASDLNRRISQKRATAVEDALKRFKVPNKSYPVGIGSTNLISTRAQSKNRAVEVWIVLP